MHNIVRQSGGYMEVESQLEHGTTFKIYLPQIEEREKSEAGQAVTLEVRGSETVLLVEDEVMIRDLLKRSLGEKGYAVLTAENGQQALEMADENREGIDLLLIDMVMSGGINGFDLAQRISKLRPQMKVLYGTS